MNILHVIGRVAAVALAIVPPTASACTVCMGDTESNTAGAMNAAIFVMLGCIFSMLGLLAAFGIHLARRANTPLPPHLEFLENSATQAD